MESPNVLPSPSTGAGVRRREPELMDDPALDPREHRRALAGLARINRLSLAATPLWREIVRACPEASSLKVLDLASGGGDVAVALWRRGRRAGRVLDITGLDASPRAVQLARERAGAVDARTVRFEQADVLAAPLPGHHDVVMSSLFFHHLSEADSVELLAGMAAAASLVLVEDLRRCAFGSALAALVPRLLTRSRVVHVDAVRSARAAYSANEMLALASRAGLAGARLRHHWPARQLLIWEAGT